jgi:hypothetical protein
VAYSSPQGNCLKAASEKMDKVTFNDPRCKNIESPSDEFIDSVFLNPPEDYWKVGKGGAMIEYKGTVIATLIVMQTEEFGFYLKYLDARKDEWLSLGDPERLDEVTDAGDEWYASIGLFITKVQACSAVKDFCRTGRRSEKINWITPDQIPEDGNW